MPTKPNKKVERARRRQQVAELYVQGWTQYAIAEHFQICQTTVCFDLKALRKEWRESSIRDFDTLRDVELKKLERVEREAWSAWERSQKPLQSAVVGHAYLIAKAFEEDPGFTRDLAVTAAASYG